MTLPSKILPSTNSYITPFPHILSVPLFTPPPPYPLYTAKEARKVSSFAFQIQLRNEQHNRITAANTNSGLLRTECVSYPLRSLRMQIRKVGEHFIISEVVSGGSPHKGQSPRQADRTYAHAQRHCRCERYAFNTMHVFRKIFPQLNR
jgi:hypothetical protein